MDIWLAQALEITKKQQKKEEQRILQQLEKIQHVATVLSDVRKSSLRGNLIPKAGQGEESTGEDSTNAASIHKRLTSISTR